MYTPLVSGCNVTVDSQFPRNPKGSVIVYGELLFTCSSILSVVVLSAYIIDSISAKKNV